MTPAPCYDVVNKQDCPNRKWCLAHGRSKCEKWTKYEQIHKAEKDAIYQDKLVYQADREAVKARRDRYLKAYTHGRYRIGSN